jgi:hypothetical protein
MAFRTGPDINPFSAAAREGILLLESVTPAQIAAAVPRIVITKIDFRTGRPVEDTRPLMFDLVETPQFGSIGGQEFGVDRERFLERATVSLLSLDVKTQLQYGVDALREVTLKFTVHRPDIVFDRSSKIPWREILEEGKSFSLEYGWIANPAACPNDLFNGFGHVSDDGTVIKATQTVLLLVSRYITNLKQSGEVDVTIVAYENGDVALRETRFADVAGAVIGSAGQPGPNGEAPKVRDDDAARSLFTRFKQVTPTVASARGRFVRLGDVLDEIAAPMIEAAAKQFGYRGNPPVQMSIANFNFHAGRQSDAWGGRHMGGSTSIADFLVPLDRLVEQFSRHLASGRAMLLRNFLNILLKFVNADEAWSHVVGSELRPLIGVSYETVRTRDGMTLVMMVLDRNAVGDNVKRLKRLPLDRQTKAEIMKALADANVPVLEFSRAGSLILDASFEMQPEPLLQSIQVETAEAGRKDRVQKTRMPDTESRRGQALPHDIIPISILEGNVVLHGNFVLNPFDRIWVEFFGSSSISGIFNVIEKNDRIEPGKFTSSYHLISEGIDPLNTRFRFTPQERP